MKCFACDKLIMKEPRNARTFDGQHVLVGPECAKKIPHVHKGREHGYQPPKGGPRLFNMALIPCVCYDSGEFKEVL